ncbi:IS30 family transposase [Actinomadura napierensis]|uniref:IS30-like element ISCfr4 family transposase n=1 Tax=Actinomadura napierensis TaxID=267854 RepID=A0ABN3AMK8_9ACTN
MRDYGFSAVQQDELWRLWKEGASLGFIARSLGAELQHVRRFLGQTGGVRVSPPRRSPHHLTSGEREEISRGIVSGLSARAIARQLRRPASTVSREIQRNGGRDAYRAHEADVAALQRSHRPKKAKLASAPVLRALVEEMLDQRWSPVQIAGRLELLFPDEPAMRVSHETIYLSLYDPRRRAIDRKLSRRLRTARLMRRPRKARAITGQGQIKDMTPIKARPPEIEDRVVPGHWEGDLIMGTRPSAIATLVERTSRYVKLVALPDGNKAHDVRPHLTRAALDIPSPLRLSMTWDRGREMADHLAFTAETGMPVYFCESRSPWQRGSNENTNGLLRQYLPKYHDLRKLTQADLDAIAAELNGRPRETHGFLSSSEVYSDLCGQVDALIH